MAEDGRYDAIMVGSGQAAGPLATALAAAGQRVALVERAHVGGTCINEGCTPTKTMVASAREAWLAGHGAEFGVTVQGVHVEMATVRDRKRRMVTTFREGSAGAIERGGVELLWGEASFTGPKTLEVVGVDGASRVLQAPTIVIDTGCRPSRPPIRGLEEVTALDSTSVMELDSVPEHLIILGGGYVALEFAQMFRRFGSRVTVVERGSQLLGREDEDVAHAVEEIFSDDGIETVFEAEATGVEKVDGQVQLEVRHAGGTGLIEGSHLLVAVGRVPNTEALHLSRAGIEVNERGFVQVNGRLETSVPGVFAVGDVTGGPQFTHIAYDDFRILRRRLLDNEDATTAGRLVPYTVFIDPQLGRVGLSEREARESGREVEIYSIPMEHVARAIESGETRGLMKAVVEKGTGQILGCAVLGMEGGEIMAMLQIAMMGGLPVARLRDGIFAHPTLAEGLNTLFS